MEETFIRLNFSTNKLNKNRAKCVSGKITVFFVVNGKNILRFSQMIKTTFLHSENTNKWLQKTQMYAEVLLTLSQTFLLINTQQQRDAYKQTGTFLLYNTSHRCTTTTKTSALLSYSIGISIQTQTTHAYKDHKKVNYV